MSRICGGVVDDLAAAQMTLPLANGGLGLTSASQIAPAAFLGSVASSAKTSSIPIRPEF
jgi:hypothetical protein